MRSAAGWARFRRSGTRCSCPPARSRSSSASIPTGELASVYEPDLAIVSSLPAFAAALRHVGAIAPRWRDWLAEARADYEANLRHEPMEGPVDLGEIMAFLRRRCPPTPSRPAAPGTTPSGRIASPSSRSTGRRFVRVAVRWGTASRLRSRRSSSTRIGRAVLHGRRRLRDELPRAATAVQYELPIVILLVNNGMYATIRMHQERQYPGRVSGTDLRNPDFIALAEAYGAFGERVERTADFERRSRARSSLGSPRCSSSPSIRSGSAPRPAQ